jgi:hypothetical protein
MNHTMSHNEHQDWNTVVIRGGEARGSAARAAATRPARSAAAAAAIRAENDEKPRVRYLSVESVAAIQEYRRTHAKTQRELDQLCSFAAGTVNGFESRKAAPSSHHLSTLSRVIGATLTLEKV